MRVLKPQCEVREELSNVCGRLVGQADRIEHERQLVWYRHSLSTPFVGTALLGFLRGAFLGLFKPIALALENNNLGTM